MPLESASWLDDLVVTNPVGATDKLSGADDHLRLIKTVLKASFPSLTGFARYLEQARADVSDSATPAIYAAATNYVNLLGATTVTGFDSNTSGQIKLCRVNADRQLTHHATTLDLPSGANIAAKAGDHFLVMARGTTSNKVIFYQKADGKALVETAVTASSISALAQGKHTIGVMASAMGPTSGAAASYNTYNSIPCLDFDEGDKARFLLPMPKSWDEGTLQFRWRGVVPSGGGSSQTGVFSLAGRAFGDGDAFSASFGTAQDSSSTWAADNSMMVGGLSSAITLAGSPADNDLVIFELTRSASGTLGASVQVSLLAIDILYTVNAINDA